MDQENKMLAQYAQILEEEINIAKKILELCKTTCMNFDVVHTGKDRH
jgi:RNA polymerase-interacting CarD/CdnL/TRCF family regulator